MVIKSNLQKLIETLSTIPDNLHFIARADFRGLKIAISDKDLKEDTIVEKKTKKVKKTKAEAKEKAE